MWQTQTSGNEVWRYISWVAAAYIPEPRPGQGWAAMSHAASASITTTQPCRSLARRPWAEVEGREVIARAR
jgi:hypothetical protein